MAATTLHPFTTHHKFFNADVEFAESFRKLAAEQVTKRQKCENESPAIVPPTLQSSSQPLVPNSLSHDVSQNSDQFKAQLELNLQQWESLHQRELELIQQAKALVCTLGYGTANRGEIATMKDGKDAQSPLQSTHLASEIYKLLEQKSNALGPLFQAVSNPVPVPTQQHVQPRRANNKKLLLKVSQRPPEAVVVNQFIDPAPIVQVGGFDASEELDTSELFASVSLLYHDTDKEVEREILQGVTRVSVLKDGSAVFDKLLITEVSAKHKYQSFAFRFSLEEGYSKKKILTSVNSAPFHTQTRPARVIKRKREEDNYGSSSDEDFVLSTPEKVTAYETYDTKATGPVVHSDYNYVDITDLLTLPQKEAASKLGISESMLCKRFKECTRRKWPYRYIRKIDKIINMLCVQDGTPLSVEDKKKLDKLLKEREERLQPVKIRITQHDRSNQVTSSPSPSSPLDSPVDTTAGFDDEAQFVMETLELLKTTRRSP